MLAPVRRRHGRPHVGQIQRRRRPSAGARISSWFRVGV